MLRLGTGGVLAAVTAPAFAQAQTWPQRPVKLVLPLGPGAGVDITARLLGDRLAAKWGQSVVIENRPGGDGVVAVSSFAGAQDDHTLLVSPTSSFTHHPWTHDKLPYDPSELVPIARMTNTLVAVVVPASSPINSLAELVAAARAQPGKLNWATITGFFDFVFEGFQKKANLEIARVPYRNTVQAASDLAEGRIQVMLAAYAIVLARVWSERQPRGRLLFWALLLAVAFRVPPAVAPVGADSDMVRYIWDGRVQRLGPPHWPVYPPGAAYGRLYPADPAAALAAARLGARLIAADLFALGIDVDCLPLADVPPSSLRSDERRPEVERHRTRCLRDRP